MTIDFQRLRKRLLPEMLKSFVSVADKKKCPFAIILAGHNGSGKSTMWHTYLSEVLQVPLINADRMMLSILPEASHENPLPKWAVQIRDKHENWMKVAQKGVEIFVAQAMEKKISFAMETVFSYWKVDPETGKIESKIDTIRQLQKTGYYVILLFVGLKDSDLSIGRVRTRISDPKTPGHDVPDEKLIERFPRTQKAIRNAVTVADVSILVDNSRMREDAFTICRIQEKKNVYYDLRLHESPLPEEIEIWLSKVCPDYPSEDHLSKLRSSLIPNRRPTLA